MRGRKRVRKNGEEGERNVSRMCHIPALCRISCLFTPFTGGNEVRGDGCCSLLSVLQQRDEGMRDDIHSGQHHTDVHLKSHMWNIAHMKHGHDWKSS